MCLYKPSSSSGFKEYAHYTTSIPTTTRPVYIYLQYNNENVSHFYYILWIFVFCKKYAKATQFLRRVVTILSQVNNKKIF